MTVPQLRTAALRSHTVAKKAREVWLMIPDGSDEASLALAALRAAERLHQCLLAGWLDAAEANTTHHKDTKK